MVYVAGLLIGYFAARMIGQYCLFNHFTDLPFSFAASLGRGYLPPVGLMFLALFSSQVVASIGYGAYFPYSVAALYGVITG